MRYYSQYGQDEFLNKRIFHSKENGFFVDVGAHDGLSFSNTAFFEKHLNWNGICIEPNPEIYQKLCENRKSRNLNLCISNQSGKDIEFLQISGHGQMLSGIYSNYDKQHIEKIDKIIEVEGGKKKIIKVKTMKLASILDSVGHEIDYCSIDVEGSELNILESINFKKSRINVFSIENNYRDLEIYKFMTKNNYRLLYRINCDEIYEYKSRRYYLMFEYFVSSNTKKVKKKLKL